MKKEEKDCQRCGKKEENLEVNKTYDQQNDGAMKGYFDSSLKNEWWYWR